MRKLFILFLFLVSTYAHAQVQKGTGIFYFTGEPTLPVNVCYDGEVGIDTTTGLWWEYSRDFGFWILAGFRVQKFATCAAPTYTPADKQSEIVLNDCDSLYRWRAGAWHHINPSGGGAGTDLTFSGASSPVTLNSSTGTDVTITAGTGISLAATSTDIVITNTAPDQVVSITNGGGVVVSGTYPAFTMTAVDQSTTNELQTLANTSNATTHTVTLSSSGGSIQLAEGAGVTLTTTGTGLDGIVTIASTITQADGSETIVTAGSGISVTGVGTSGNPYVVSNTGDLSATNEAWTIDADDADTELITTQTVKFQGGGIVVTDYIPGTDILTITATEVDGSVTNEAWTVDADAGDTEVISNQTLLFSGSGIVTTSYNAAGNTVTITGTEVDGSTSNELQTLANTSNATTHTVTLSNSGGSIQLVEGANVTLTTTGTGLDGIVTIAATSGSGTDLSFSGTSSPVTLNSSSGTDVTFTQGGIVTISATSGNITISATEVDGSVTNEAWTIDGDDADTEVISNQTVKFQGAGITTTDYNPATDVLLITSTEVDGSTSNELQIYGHSGTTSYTNTLSNGGGSFTLQSSGIVTISNSSGTVTIGATEVDGSVTNELQTLANTSNATTHTVTLSNSGGSIQLVEGANVTLTTTGTGLDGIVTIAATSGSGTDLSFSGTSSPVTLVSNTGTDVTITAGTGISLSATATDIIITNTVVNTDAQNLTIEGAGPTYDIAISGGSDVTIQGAGIVTLSESPANTLIVTATEVDGSVTNEGILGVGAGSATSSTLLSNTSGANAVTINAAGIPSISESTSSNGGSITLTATEVDGSTSNELQTYGHSGTTSYTNTLSNGGGSFTLQSGGIVTLSHSTGTTTISATEVDGSVTNEAWTIDGDDADTEVISNQTVKFQGAGITVTDYNPTTDVLLITSTEVDGSVSNELQTLANTSNATTHTVTLSNSGGSIQLVEGANVTLTTTGTGLDGIVTIAATSGSGTDLSFSGTSSPVTLNSNTGTDVTFTQGGIVTISATSGNITISATEVDGSTTNELQTYGHAGTTTYTNTLSNGGGSFSITGAGINVVSQTAGAVTITGTEVDGSTSNELQTYGHAGTTTYTNTLSNGGGSFTLQSSGIVTISNSSGTVTIGATEVDGSVTNELQTIANTSDGTSHTVTLSNSGGSVQMVEGTGVSLTTTGTSGAGIVTIANTGDLSATNEAWTIDGDDADTELITTQTVKFQGGGITTTDYNPTTDVLLITSTEVDGSTSNELQTYGHAGTTTYTNTLSNGGGSFTLQSSGIVTISNSSGTVTIGATEVDGSVSNELQTLANTSNATTHTVTLSNSGGSVQLAEGSGITLTTTGTGLDGVVTIASTAGATDLTFSGASSPVTLNSSTGTDVTITAGGIVSLSATSGNITISATEVDGSTSNELQTYGHAGTTTYTNTLSNGGGSFSITGAGINVVSQTAGAVTITATEVDGSVTNEGVLGVGAGSGTSSTLLSNTSGANAVTINAAGIMTISESTSSNGGSITLTATEVDGSTSNELQTISANGAGPTSYTIDLSSGGGAVTLAEGTGIDLTRSTNTITITSTATGTVTGAENGLNVVANKVRLGGNLITSATSIEGDGNELRFFDGKLSVSSWTGFANSPVQPIRFQALEASPTINSTPTLDGIIEFRIHNAAGSDQPNSLTIGAYSTDADGIWMQARSASVPNFYYPVSMQPRGGQWSVGRLNGLDALATISGTALSGSTVSGSVLHLENNEGNGKAAMSMGIGIDAMDSEIAWFDATDALRITNRSNTAGTSSVRITVGGETADKVIITPTSAASNTRMGVGYTSTTNMHSTVQSAGSYAGNVIVSSSAITLDETQWVRVFSGSTNTTWTLPTASTCFGRHYVIMHHGSAGTLTLSASVTKANASTFNTLAAGEFAQIWSDGSTWRGFKQTSL